MGSEEKEYRGLNRADRKPAADFRSLSIRILHYANRGTSIIAFLRQLTKIIREFSSCDSVELKIKDADIYYHAEAAVRPKKVFNFEVIDPDRGPDTDSCISQDPMMVELCRRIIEQRLEIEHPFMTKNGSFWIPDTDTPLELPGYSEENPERPVNICGPYKTVAFIPFVLEDESIGLLILKSIEKYYLTGNDIELYEGIAQSLGLAIADRRARADCSERVKELSCLYGIANIAGLPDISLNDSLIEIVKLLPPGWQYPEITCARITLDDREYLSADFEEGVDRQSSEIVVDGVLRGRVDVIYKEKRPKYYEGPFLKEERNLIDAVGREVALVIERKEAEATQRKLQEQLRHADRLATIGQLAAGVAHELNEPLGSILGFAQLALKNTDVTEETEQDLDKIVQSSLHAREVVKKLLIFGRQMPTKKTRFDLNDVIENGIYFLESRCAKMRVELVKKLDPGLPGLYADQSQIHQVLVNLMVNAIQAMPEGGTLTIETSHNDEQITFSVGDDGVGMPEDIKQKIFMPFFTTKDVGEGTGLGLAVVHGIITSHGGTIEVESRVGEGSKFIVRLPVTTPDNRRSF